MGTMQARRSAARRRAVKTLPLRVGLQLARLVPSAPEGDAWLHEVKFDGYRVLLWRNGRKVVAIAASSH
jgi:bifunctional non-homologous end joining protein LigD